jgi:hypothetical protein
MWHPAHDLQEEDIYDKLKVLRQYERDFSFKDSFAALLDGLNS